ncbi:MAG: anaerobic ribonucleoside-triphosphate reductase activating protein [Candidatus Diapherotrites archaeon]
MQINGLQKTTLIDFPGKVACTVFLAGCNFRCPYCQNPDLIEGSGKLPAIPEEEFFGFLEGRKKWLDGVCITGGEPTINGELPRFVKKITELGFAVKLDTNGTNPEMLAELLKAGLLDYVAMDIKAPLGRYTGVARVKADADAVKKSAALLMKSGVEYEFRTTVVPGLFDEKDAREIAKWLKGAEKYYIQQFNPRTRLLDRAFEKIEPYPGKRLEGFGKIMKPSFRICEIRGI